jgi:polysaccharide pyruvyl transferase WcaK-like protein
MQILIEPSDYSLLNVGDAAMVEVAATRLNALWPAATLQILSDTPELLPGDLPRVTYLSTAGRRQWFEGGYLSITLLSQRFSMPLVPRIEGLLRRRRPEWIDPIKHLRRRLAGKKEDSPDSFLPSMQSADLVVVTGMGGITDAFPDYALQLLHVLNFAKRLGKTTAMFGQGMGPLQNPKLRARAREVLPHVDLIALREGRVGRSLLDSLGVTREHVLVTGDDAIEIAFDRRVSRLGDGLGVNVRSAAYSGITQSSLQQLGPMLLEAASACRASIVAVPTSRHRGEQDSSALRKLLAGHSLSDYGEGLDTPRKVIDQIQRCRVLVTASYHAAVFSLAQGTPVVCLVNSDYYADKFMGLVEQFGGGGEIISLQDSRLAATLPQSVAKVWHAAEQVRPALLASARKQIAQGRAAYQQLYDIVCAKGKNLITSSASARAGR